MRLADIVKGLEEALTMWEMEIPYVDKLTILPAPEGYQLATLFLSEEDEEVCIRVVLAEADAVKLVSTLTDVVKYRLDDLPKGGYVVTINGEQRLFVGYLTEMSKVNHNFLLLNETNLPLIFSQIREVMAYL